MVTTGASLRAELVRLGLFPNLDSVPDLHAGDPADLLAPMIEAFSRSSASLPVSRLDANRIEWLKHQHARGSRLTCGLPGPAHAACQRWIGPRLAWWPRGIPAGRRLGFVSSRLGRRLENRKPWFDLFRTACTRAKARNDLLVTADSTTTARFINRAAVLLGVRVLSIQISDDEDLERWIESIFTTDSEQSSPQRELVRISAPLDQQKFSVDAIVRDVPERDRAVVAFCDELFVLSLRPHGNLDRLTHARLESDRWPVGSVYISLDESLIGKKISDELLEAGAVGWMTTESSENTLLSCLSSISQAKASRVNSRIIHAATRDDWSYLTHCTRRRDAPWPGEDEEDYIDDLILQRSDANHSAVAALARIVRSKKIFASSQAIRGKHRVVCLTENPLPDIPGLRRYRSHRVRWDFEPYGICVDRSWMEQHGARPVQYGDDQTWAALAADDRPFFQLRGMRDDSRCDQQWTSEKEWRNLGDVDLSDLPGDAGFLFVPSREEAVCLDRISRWPVIVLTS